jgi:hypothetical protein
MSSRCSAGLCVSHLDISVLLCDYAANDSFEDTGEDSDELSFKRGDILDIIDKSTTYWRARKADGTSGGECDRGIYSSFHDLFTFH